ncbi:C45 family autoproteolytic acyltransferase/hydolase [Mariniluteicoccus flavus]
MIVHEHDSGVDPTPERGEQFGRRYAESIRTSVGLYRDWFATSEVPGEAVGRITGSCREALADWAPDLLDESDTIARGAGLEPDSVFMLTCRTEIVAAAQPTDPGAARPTECSTLVAAPPAGRLSFQTWDWVTDLVPEGVMWQYAPAPGRRTTAFVEPGMVGKLGLNDRGLSVHLNFLSHAADGGDQPGVPIHAIQRAVLDRASTVAEAIEIALSAPLVASSALTVVADDGAASIELCPAGTAVVRPDAAGWLAHTNHFVDPRLAGGDLATPAETTWARQAYLEEAAGRLGPLLRDGGSPGLPEVARALVREDGVRAPICLLGNPKLPEHRRSRTQLTVLFDGVAGRVDYLAGNPADAAVKPVLQVSPPPA